MMHDTGWEQPLLNVERDEMMSLIEFKDELLNIVSREVGITVSYNSFHAIPLHKLEMAKSIIRGFLRYDNSSVFVIKAIARHIAAKMPHLRFFTLPYPIIHLPGDTSEPGAMHTDGQVYAGAFLTTWTPLGNCWQKPLTIIGKDGVEAKPDVMVGEYLMWDGAIQHEGVLNATNEPHIVLVSKFTEKPLLNERTHSIDNLSDSPVTVFHHKHLISIKKFIHLYNEISNYAAGDWLNPTPPIDLFEYALRKVESWGLTDEEKKQLSFALTLYAQRMEPHNKNVLLFYVFSVAIYQDNLLGIQKIIDYSVQRFPSVIAHEFSSWFVAKYPSRQATFCINSAVDGMRFISEQNNILEWEE